MPVSSPKRTPVGQVICTVSAAYSFLGTKASTSATLGNGNTRAAPIYVPEGVTLDRIGCEITSAGDAGCTVRLGIWRDRGEVCLPDALLLDAGTVAGDSTGVKEITISQALTAGIYWLSGTVQGVTAVQPTVRITAAGSETVVGGVYHTTVTGSATTCGATRSGDTGALPSSWSTTLGNSGAATRIFVRVV